MMAQAPDTVRRRQGDDHPPDFAAVMMARAMAEMFQDEPNCPIPEPLAAILRQMERWEDEQAHRAGRAETLGNQEPKR
ncbi:hypothetical protein [Microvirga tunisiensis]|uniref:Uncharacterized protein n=1 Tax=Microvirga tunisiensis TaxID=2108360 RepID=A0A5N7MQ40_9HYPH|nr:hypothetical protein [Microvirga tunisiensis]MPR10977.1 hypothetical protein [Microvirga tunisiensis]MPR29115.1 hypothetical protein [Microvirga tunisiensis]